MNLITEPRLALLLMALLSGLPFSAREIAAQDASLTGRVVDADTGNPLPGVNLFLDQTTRGAASTDDGTYEISGLHPGSYRVVASAVGYGIESILLEVVPARGQYTSHFRLKSVVVELEGFEVGGERPRGWKKNLQRFEKGFLGSSANARMTEILNPYVLDFETADGRFSARASTPLTIENRALGYRLIAVLSYYYDTGRRITMGGPVSFYELEPSDSAEAARWRENREIAYRGSFMHLMRSLVQGNSRQQGFFVAHEIPRGAYGYGKKRRVDVGLIPFIGAGDHPYQYRLDFEHLLYVEYGRETSWLRLTVDEATLHEDGYLYSSDYDDPPMSVSGDMSNRRVADMLPRDYQAH